MSASPPTTPKLTEPQKHVVRRLREGAILRSRPAAGISPWLETPGRPGEKVQHVSFLTAAGLYDYGLITHDTATDPMTGKPWKLTQLGQEIPL